VAYVDLERIIDDLERWIQFFGSYPSSISEMVLRADSPAGSPGPEQKPKDPFGNEYKLEFIDSKPSIIFYGRDGVAGGTGEDRDWRWPQDRIKARPVHVVDVIR
jgi:hypothetical protein